MVPDLSAERVLVVAATHVVTDQQVLLDVAWSPLSSRMPVTGPTISGLREVISRDLSPATWSPGALIATRSLHDLMCHSLLVSGDPLRDTRTLEALFTEVGLTPQPWCAMVVCKGTADQTTRCAVRHVEVIVDALTGARSGAVDQLRVAVR